MKYLPYGSPRSGYPTGSVPTDRRFTGQRSEEATLGSLYDYGARFYSPVVGRFLSADTIVPGAGNPQAWNRYSYTVNNPLKYTDPSGHCFILCAVVGFFVGVAAYTADAVINQTGWDLGGAVGSGAIGAVGGATFGAGLAVGGTIAGAIGATSGTAASVAGATTVAASSVAAGQVTRAVVNVASGEDPGKGLFQLGDMVKDAVIGLVGFKVLGGKFNQVPRVPAPQARVPPGSTTKFTGDEFWVDGDLRGGPDRIILNARNVHVGGDVRGGESGVIINSSNVAQVSGSVIGETGGVSITAKVVSVLKDVVGRFRIK